MFNVHQGECDMCHNVKMVSNKWINGSIKTLCAGCMRDLEAAEAKAYEEYLIGLSDPRD